MYQPYETPSLAGITFVSGSFTPQPAWDGQLSYQADAQAYVDGMNVNLVPGQPAAKLVNAVNTPAANITFFGVKSGDAAQPWMVTWDGVAFFFAGIAIKQQVAATKAVLGLGTTGYPGVWAKDATGVWDFTPNPLGSAVPPPVAPNPADAAAWAALQGAGSLTEEQKDQLLINIAIAVGAKVPN